MAKVKDVYNAALSIMGEDDDRSYEGRVVNIVNTLIGQCWQASEDYETGSRAIWLPVENMDDEIIGIDQNIALAVMPYGLAGLLYLQEDAAQANTWWQIYQEEIYRAMRTPVEFDEIDDVYGGVTWEYNNGGRW